MNTLQRPTALRPYLLTLAASTLLTFLALYASVFALVDGFSLTVDAPALVGLCLLFALLSSLIYSVPRQSLCVGLLFLSCGLLALYAWWRWDDFANGAQVLFHQISLGFHQAIPSILFYELPRALSRGYQRQCATLFLSASLPLLALWVCPWLSQGWPVWPAVGAVAGLVIVPLLVLYQPSPLTLAAFLLFLALVILSRKGFRDSAVAGARRVFAALIPTALVMALLGTLLPDGFNPRPLWLEDLRLNLQALPNTSFAIGVGGSRTVIPGEQDFASAGPLRFNGHTVLQIRSDSRERQLLLRGFSAGQYTERGWVALDDADYPLANAAAENSPCYYPAYAQNGAVASDTIRITDFASQSDYYYVPYFPTVLPADATYHADSYLTRPASMDDYTLSFLSPSNVVYATIPSGDAVYWQYQYRNWVYDNYWRGNVPIDLLSDETAAFLACFWADGDLQQMHGDVDLELPGGGSVTWHRPDGTYDDRRALYLAYAHSVADLLASFTEYDQSTPVTPPGQDFVSYFLTTSRRGYCLHYASAATLILRAAGIPARYVSGYVARSSRPNSVVNVPDRNAHAWVEIYIDGFGWQPVDVTPGFSGGGNLADFEGEYAAASTSPAPSAAGASASPSVSPSPSANPSKAPSKGGVYEKFPSLRPLLYTFLVLLGVALAVGAICLQHRWRLFRIRQKMSKFSQNQSAVFLYQSLIVMERQNVSKVPPEAKALAEKAYFSQHIITEEELDTMRGYVQNAIEAAKGLPLPKRLILRYVYALW